MRFERRKRRPTSQLPGGSLWATTTNMVLQYLFVFAQVHDDFRIPELLSVAELLDINITLPKPAHLLDVSRPFMVLGLDREEDARNLAKRCMLIKWVFPIPEISASLIVSVVSH